MSDNMLALSAWFAVVGLVGLALGMGIQVLRRRRHERRIAARFRATWTNPRCNCGFDRMPTWLLDLKGDPLKHTDTCLLNEETNDE